MWWLWILKLVGLGSGAKKKHTTALQTACNRVKKLDHKRIWISQSNPEYASCEAVIGRIVNIEGRE
jgi:hypothetical protein